MIREFLALSYAWLAACERTCHLNWQTVRSGSAFNPDRHWALAPESGNAVTRWQGRIPGRAVNEDGLTIGHMCDSGQAAKPTVFEVLLDATIDDSGCRLEWVNINTMDRENLTAVIFPSPQSNYAPCLVPAENYTKELMLTKCDLKANTGSFCLENEEVHLNPLPNTTVVLTLRSVERREFSITSVPEITPQMATKRPQTVVHRSFRNYGLEEQEFRVEQGFEWETESAFSHEHSWRVELETEYENDPLHDAVQGFLRRTFAEGHGLYETETREIKRQFVELKDEIKVAGRTKVTVAITVFREELHVPYEGEEVFFDKWGKEMGKARVKGTWTGVTTFLGETDLYHEELDRHEPH